MPVIMYSDNMFILIAFVASPRVNIRSVVPINGL